MEDTLKQGEALFTEGKIEQAEKWFLKKLKKEPQNKEVFNNLGVIAFQGQQINKAIEYFNELLKIDPFYKEGVLNYSYLLKELNLLNEASPFLEKVLEAYPNDKELQKLLNESKIMEKPKRKIAVLCLPGLQSFLADIVDFLNKKYQVRTCYSNNNKEIEDTIHWADVVWIEWANELAIALTNHPTLLNGKHLVCRLHSYDALAGFVQKIKWEKIDDLIFVAKHIKDIVLQQEPNLSSIVNNIHIVPNGVNLDKFVFRDRSKGKNLAYLGHINYKKGPMLLLHAFRELVQGDKKSRLFIGGNFQDARYELYFSQMVKEMDLTRNIQFDGWIDNVAHWLKDKHYIVCTSVLEGHPIGLMEAMASGIKPVIHNFIGAKDIFPEKYLWNTIPEFCHIIASEDYSSIEYKNYIEKYYSLNKQLYSIENVISNASVMKKRKSRLNLRNNIGNASISDNDFIYKSVSSGYPEEQKITNGEIKEWYNKFLGNLKKDHERQNPRHEQIKQTLKKIIKAGMNVLDIGCGTGISSKYMGELGAEVIGVDISDELIKFAMNESAHQNVKYIVEDATQINLQMSFDAITIIDSMEHIPREKIDDFVKSIDRHVSKKSIIYLNIPDGRYQRYIKMNHPEKHQIIDEDYDPNMLISMFQKIGFQPYHVSIYGIDVPIQYNEYLFMTDDALGNIFKKSFQRIKN
jgi:SAM-dependent methyltransferase